jgi:hypothetical protein
MTNNINQTTGITTTIASAYNKATATYDHIMEPIRFINKYVDSKNDLDRSLENNTISKEEYNEEVHELQTNTFGSDAKKLAIANKFEAVADWKEAHGIDKIQNSIHEVTASIKNAFAKTSFGQKFAEIKEVAAQMSGVQHDETKAAGTKMSTSDKETGLSSRRAAMANELVPGGGSITAEASMQAGN